METLSQPPGFDFEARSHHTPGLASTCSSPTFFSPVLGSQSLQHHMQPEELVSQTRTLRLRETKWWLNDSSFLGVGHYGEKRLESAGTTGGVKSMENVSFSQFS